MGNFSFSFLILCFNHQRYIIQHLESIKYLIINYGYSYDIDILISDDSSKDKTVLLIELWLKNNEFLFKNIKRFYNKKNIGTAKVVRNLLNNVSTSNFKLTAGDDMYSFENLFEYSILPDDVSFLSGRTIVCNDEKLIESNKINLLESLSESIYTNKSLTERFKHFSYTNAPNLFYSNDVFDDDVLEYLSTFDVTEDLPLQYIIAKRNPKNNFKLVNKVFVYYRRTSGSTYLVANNRFKNDKIKIYNDMINDSENKFDRLRIRSRLFCFMLDNYYLNRILNLDFYLFIFNCLSKIKKSDLIFSLDYFKKHSLHFEKINVNSHEFIENNTKHIDKKELTDVL